MNGTRAARVAAVQQMAAAASAASHWASRSAGSPHSSAPPPANLPPSWSESPTAEGRGACRKAAGDVASRGSAASSPPGRASRRIVAAIGCDRPLSSGWSAPGSLALVMLPVVRPVERAACSESSRRCRAHFARCSAARHPCTARVHPHRVALVTLGRRRLLCPCGHCQLAWRVIRRDVRACAPL